MESLGLTKLLSQPTVTPSSPAEYEIFLTDPSQLDDLEAWCQDYPNVQQQNQQQQYQHSSKYPSSIHVRLAQRLFGPPRISLSWKQRCHLFQLLKKIPNLTTITIHGTTMGQVISAELLSTGVPSCLRTLKVDAGLIFDQLSSVQKLANALQSQAQGVGSVGSQLQHLQLYNFLNHVRPIQVPPTWLLDPLLYALGQSCPHLETVELACLASFLEWKVPLLSCDAIHFFLTHTPKLQKLQLTNLGLTDDEFGTLAEFITPHNYHHPDDDLDHSSLSNSSSSSRCSLQQLIVNGNENTIVGLRRLILQCLSIGSTITHLEVLNHVKLTEDLYEYIVWYTEQYNCPLQWFEVTFPLRMDPTLLRLHLRLQQLHLAQQYYSPLATMTTKIQVLGQVSDDPNCLFRLLQQQPNLLLERSKQRQWPMITATNNNKNTIDSTDSTTDNPTHNHDDEITIQETRPFSQSDMDVSKAHASPTTKTTTLPPQHSSPAAKWILPITSTGSSSLPVLGLVTLLLVLFFLVLPASGPPPREDSHDRPSSSMVGCNDDKDGTNWGQSIIHDSFPWNNNNNNSSNIPVSQ